MPRTKCKTDRLTLIRVAGLVPCDPRTVEKYFETRKPLTLVAEHNIRRALASLGMPDPRAEGGAK